ncbi:MAG: hypothetical protein HY973_01835 [Candidatus Kerfeldbacteria bacterium]|nr:hypothetical protein [Candidatus Kerfeldbacteria bacterium]
MTNSNDHWSSVGKAAVFVSSQPNGAEFETTLQLPSQEYKFLKLRVVSAANQQIEFVDVESGSSDIVYCQFFMVGNTFQLPKVLKNKIGVITVIWKHD